MTSFVIGNTQSCSYRALKRLNNVSGVSLSQCMLIVSVFEYIVGLWQIMFSNRATLSKCSDMRTDYLSFGFEF